MPYFAYQPYQSVIYAQPLTYKTVYVETEPRYRKRSSMENLLLCCLYGSLVAVTCCLCVDTIHLFHHVF